MKFIISGSVEQVFTYNEKKSSLCARYVRMEIGILIGILVCLLATCQNSTEVLGA